METYALNVGKASAMTSRSFAHKKNRQCFSDGAEVCMWLGLSHRQAKHNEKTLEFMGSLTPCEDTKEM